MKKILAVLCAAALALSLSVVASAESNKNIALSANGGKIEASSDKSSQPMSNANDGDTDSYWESADSNNPNESITVSWDKLQTVEKIVMIWGGGKPSTDAGYAKVEYQDKSGDWKTLNVSVSRTDTNGSIPFTDTLAFGDAVYAQAVRVNFGAFALNGAYQCYEFQVFGEEAPEGAGEPDEPEDEPDETPAEDPDDVESGETEDVDSTEDPVESVEAPVESNPAPAESTQAPAESTVSDAEEDAPSSPILWIVLACAAVVVIVVVVIVIVKKKAKK